MGMAVWPDLVVPGADDTLAAHVDGGLRLEQRCGFGTAAVPDGPFDLRCSHCLRFLAIKAALYPLAIAGSTHCHAGAAASATGGNARACTLVSGSGPRCIVADLIGLMLALVRFESFPGSAQN